MFNIRHIQTFVTIADCGSFASAAERIGLTQSAISMQVKTIENDSGHARNYSAERRATQPGGTVR